MKHFLIGVIILLPMLSFGQPSGIYNGQFSEHCQDYVVSTACGTTFKCLYNWSSSGGWPYLEGDIIKIKSSRSQFSNGLRIAGINGGFVFEPGKTYVLDFRFKLTSSAAPLSNTNINFYVYASKFRHYFGVNNSACDRDPYIVNPANDALIGKVERYGSTDWMNQEMQFTTNDPDYWYIWIFPEWNSGEYGDVFMELDYVEIRQCGKGELNISGQVLPEWVYAKEKINLGSNITFPYLKRQFVGEQITCLPGFETPANYTGDGIEMTAVSTCLLPIQPPVVGKPGREEETSITAVTDNEMLKIYPNPAQDYIDIQNLPANSVTCDFTIINLTGQVISRHQRNRVGKAGSDQSERIDISSLPPGTYLLQVSNGDNAQISRFVKIK